MFKIHFLNPFRTPFATIYRSTTSSCECTMSRLERALGGCSTPREAKWANPLAAVPPRWTTAANCLKAVYEQSRLKSRLERLGLEGLEVPCRVKVPPALAVRTVPGLQVSSESGEWTAAALPLAAAWMTPTFGRVLGHVQALMPARWAGGFLQLPRGRRTRMTYLRTAFLVAIPQGIFPQR